MSTPPSSTRLVQYVFLRRAVSGLMSELLSRRQLPAKHKTIECDDVINKTKQNKVRHFLNHVVCLPWHNGSFMPQMNFFLLGIRMTTRVRSFNYEGNKRTVQMFIPGINKPICNGWQLTGIVPGPRSLENHSCYRGPKYCAYVMCERLIEKPCPVNWKSAGRLIVDIDLTPGGSQEAVLSSDGSWRGRCGQSII
jgi:hypothetical protein